MKKNKKLQEIADKSLSQFDDKTVMFQIERQIQKSEKKTFFKPVFAAASALCAVLVLIICLTIFLKPLNQQTVETSDSYSDGSSDCKFDEITVEQLIDRYMPLTNSSSYLYAELLSVGDTEIDNGEDSYIVSKWRVVKDYYNKISTDRDIEIFISVNELSNDGQVISLFPEAIKDFLLSHSLYLIYLPSQNQCVSLSTLFIEPIKNEYLYPSYIEDFLDSNNVKYVSSDKMFGDTFIGDTKTIQAVEADIIKYFESRQ